VVARDNGNLAAPLEPGYPAPRPRQGPAAPIVAEAYGRVEGTNGEVTVTDTDATIITFAGEPELIRITARSFGALVTLADATGLEDRPITILPNTTQDVRLPRRQVRARNLVAASAALLSVNAFFARPAEPYNR
jgi:hypothetical protein